MLILMLPSSEPPASMIRTEDPASSESLFARTHPAVPAPTKEKKMISKYLNSSGAFF
jgi:hypothetical protein